MKEILKSTLSVLALAALWPLMGCSHAPTFNILGSFFPSWLICLVIGVVLAAVANLVLTRMKLEKLIMWPVLTYPCLATFFSCILWLLFFS